MDWRPPVAQLHVVHAAGDKLIFPTPLRRLAAEWAAEYTELTSSFPAGATDAFGDDIHHEFLAKDLMQPVVAVLSTFLDACAENTP